MSAVQNRRSLNGEEVLGAVGDALARCISGVELTGVSSKQYGSFFVQPAGLYHNPAQGNAFQTSIGKYLPSGPESTMSLGQR